MGVSKGDTLFGQRGGTRPERVCGYSLLGEFLVGLCCLRDIGRLARGAEVPTGRVGALKVGWTG